MFFTRISITFRVAFDAYVAKTRQELHAMSTIKADIKADLNNLEGKLQGINAQVDEAFRAAKGLESLVEQYGKQIQKIKEDVSL